VTWVGYASARSTPCRLSRCDKGASPFSRYGICNRLVRNSSPIRAPTANNMRTLRMRRWHAIRSAVEQV